MNSPLPLPEKQVAAIILAAGRSSRMGEHKALLQLGKQTVLERVVRIFIYAGVSDIRIVTGYRGSDLRPVIARLPVQEIVNHQYQDGMYSSVRTGVASLDRNCAGFFIHPVDIPLISPGTVRTLMNLPGFDRNHIVLPEYEGKRGHPPLFGGTFRETILSATPPSGLAGLIHDRMDVIITVNVQDSGITMNMNTPGDYRRLQELMKEDNPEQGEEE